MCKKTSQFGLFFLSFFLLGAGCTPAHSPEDFEVRGVIMPHHLVVEADMRTFLAETEIDTSVDRIILLSPNHFGYGFNNLRTTDQLPESLLPIDTEAVQALTTASPLEIEPELFELEHGVMALVPLLAERFPEATLVPILTKDGTPQHTLDRLVDILLTLDLTHTLVVGSIDFTHQAAEDIALENDRHTLQWLGEEEPVDYATVMALKGSADATTNPNSVAMDSPETLYLLARLMEAQDARPFDLWKRTSSASLAEGLAPSENTSHLFGWFLAH